MKRLMLLVVILCPFAIGQTTPNIGLNIPNYGSQNWSVQMNANFTILDNCLGAAACNGTVVKLLNPVITTPTMSSGGTWGGTWAGAITLTSNPTVSATAGANGCTIVTSVNGGTASTANLCAVSSNGNTGEMQFQLANTGSFGWKFANTADGKTPIFISAQAATNSFQVNSNGTLSPGTFTFGTLPNSGLANGQFVFCSDCNSTCTAGSSTGKMCARVNGAWTNF